MPQVLIGPEDRIIHCEFMLRPEWKSVKSNKLHTNIFNWRCHGSGMTTQSVTMTMMLYM
eukprot:COSAG02_NODE_11025_length_1809_cov_2.086550_1_plen_58_part_10